MTDDDVTEVRRVVETTLQELRLHDQKMTFQAESIRTTQERLAEAIEKIGEATSAIRSLSDRLANGQRVATSPWGMKLTPQTAAWIVGGAMALGAALGGGNELAHRLLRLLPGK